MKPRFIFRPEARDELLEAQAWHERRPRAWVLRSFAVEVAVDALQRAPQQYPRVGGDIRRVLLRRFPYAIFYPASAEENIVLAVFHVARDPARWQSRT